MCSLVALAFLIPLGITLSEKSREEKLSDAARRGALVTGALAVSTDPEVVRRAVTASGDDPALRPVVHGVGADESAGRADATALADAAAQRRSVVTEVDGGVLRLDPVVLGDRVAVVEVFVPDEVLDAGAGGRWLLLLGVALALVGAAVVVVDRVAGPGRGRHRRPGQGGPRGGRRRAGRTGGADRPAGAGRGRARVQPDDGTACGVRAPTSTSWSPTCRTGCVPR